MKIVEFIYEKTIKRPKRLQDNNFVIFASERIQVQPGEKAINSSTKSDYVWLYIITYILWEWTQARKLFLYFS